MGPTTRAPFWGRRRRAQTTTTPGCPPQGTGCGPYTDAATGSQASFPIVATCAINSDPAIGGTCSANTSANATAPGAVVEGKRGLVEISAIQVFDGGPDGNPTTPGDSLFATQGIFIP